MDSFRIDIRVHCGCIDGGHDAVAFRTATPGLTVAQWVHKEGREGRWSILHHATGLAMPYDFDDPESAMACAQALSGAGEWTAVDPDYDIDAARTTLIEYGGEAYGASSYGPREQRNEVPA